MSSETGETPPADVTSTNSSGVATDVVKALKADVDNIDNVVATNTDAAKDIRDTVADSITSIADRFSSSSKNIGSTIFSEFGQVVNIVSRQSKDSFDKVGEVLHPHLSQKEMEKIEAGDDDKDGSIDPSSVPSPETQILANPACASAAAVIGEDDTVPSPQPRYGFTPAPDLHTAPAGARMRFEEDEDGEDGDYNMAAEDGGAAAAGPAGSPAGKYTYAKGGASDDDEDEPDTAQLERDRGLYGDAVVDASQQTAGADAEADFPVELGSAAHTAGSDADSVSAGVRVHDLESDVLAATHAAASKWDSLTTALAGAAGKFQERIDDALEGHLGTGYKGEKAHEGTRDDGDGSVVFAEEAPAEKAESDEAGEGLDELAAAERTLTKDVVDPQAADIPAAPEPIAPAADLDEDGDDEPAAVAELDPAFEEDMALLPAADEHHYGPEESQAERHARELGEDKARRVAEALGEAEAETAAEANVDVEADAAAPVDTDAAANDAESSEAEPSIAVSEGEEPSAAPSEEDEDEYGQGDLPPAQRSTSRSHSRDAVLSVEDLAESHTLAEMPPLDADAYGGVLYDEIDVDDVVISSSGQAVISRPLMHTPSHSVTPSPVIAGQGALSPASSAYEPLSRETSSTTLVGPAGSHATSGSSQGRISRKHSQSGSGIPTGSPNVGVSPSPTLHPSMSSPQLSSQPSQGSGYSNPNEVKLSGRYRQQHGSGGLESGLPSRTPTDELEVASEGSDAYADDDVTRSEFVDAYECNLEDRFSPSASQMRSLTPGSGTHLSGSGSANVTPSALSADPQQQHAQARTQGTPTSARQRAMMSRRGSGKNMSALGDAMGSVDLSSGPVDIYGDRKSLMLLDDVMVTCQDDGEGDDVVSADHSEGSFEEALEAYGRARRNHTPSATYSEGGLLIKGVRAPRSGAGTATTDPATPDEESPVHTRALPASLMNSQSAPNSPAPVTRKAKADSATGRDISADEDLDIAVVCDGEESPATGARGMRYDNQSMVSDFTLFSEHGDSKGTEQRFGRGGQGKKTEIVPRPKKVASSVADGREERCCAECVIM